MTIYKENDQFEKWKRNKNVEINDRYEKFDRVAKETCSPEKTNGW